MMSFVFVSWRVLSFWLNNWGDKSDSSWRDWTFINRISLLIRLWEEVHQYVGDGCCRCNILLASSRSWWHLGTFYCFYFVYFTSFGLISSLRCQKRPNFSKNVLPRGWIKILQKYKINVNNIFKLWHWEWKIKHLPK